MTSELLTLVATFWSALLAATLLPGASEIVLVTALAAGEAGPFWLVAVATVGNTLGSLINWACGRFLMHFQDRRWFPVAPHHIERFSALFHRYGVWSLLFSWAPIGGDALTVIAGIVRVNVWTFIVLVGIGKLARYVVLAAGTLYWPSL
ncbi:YqaA family protein [Jiella marina]|uniref:YqaA family protein n=1 Tax=Jiella sp. LLJ827 TaxID=2917712 RepID=UPI002101CA7D|nr:YqaA family protein [Jiella sp. LLJ827]MCQ0987255.1 DedA family protein [Jiella sp. LLJ827]